MTHRSARPVLNCLAAALTATLAAGGDALAANQGLADTALVGTQLMYEVHYRSDGYSEMTTAIGATAAQPRQNLHGNLSGVEVLTILERRGDGVLASVRFDKPVISIQVDGQIQPEREREVVQSLAHLAYVYIDRQSRVDRLEFTKSYSVMASNFVRAIILTQQFSPASGGQMTPTWDMQETGATGPYNAHYEVLESPGRTARILKTITSVNSRAGGALNSETVIPVPRGKVDIEVSKSKGTMDRLEANIHEDMYFNGKVLAAQDTVLTVRATATARVSDTVLLGARRTFERQQSTLSASVQLSPQAAAQRETTMQRQILGGDSAQSLLEATSRLDRPSISLDRGIGVYLKLKALIYLQPADVRVLTKGLSTGDLSSQSAGAILTALATVGSPEAQDALCDIVRARITDVRALTVVVTTLGSVRAPVARVVLLLQELSRSTSREIGSTALLALGAAAKNLAQDAPSRSSAIVSDLVTRLSAGSNDKSSFLLALGNTGSAVAKNTILNQRGDQSSMVRRAIAAALGGFQSVETDQALCDMLKSDEDPQVRSAAAQALSTRNSMTVVKETLSTAAQRDVAENVRLASMFALRDLLSKDPAVQRVINGVAERDRAEVVRKQAASLLRGGNSQK